MGDEAGHVFRGLARRLDGWCMLAICLAILVILPILSVVWIALVPRENIWPHLVATTLPRYLVNSVLLVASVGILAGVIGTGTAWLVVMTRFPGRGVLEWALLLPLALPAYIAAFAMVDFLEYAGPVQVWLRETFGWDTRHDYIFPAVRSRSFATVVLGFALYPYVYFPARAVFRAQSAAALEVARALGQSGWGAFWRVGLPLARPAIVAGVAIVMMETLNEFGAMEFFGIQTLTTGIFTVWLEASNAGGAAQLACVMLGLVLVLAGLETSSRRNIRFHETARQMRAPVPTKLNGWPAVIATLACIGPIIAGFIMPLLIIATLGLHHMGEWAEPDLWYATMRTVLMGGAAAVLTVLAAIALVYGARLCSRRLVQGLIPVTTIGYAVPGAMLGLGVLLPLAWVDHLIADSIMWLTGFDPGLLLVGSAGAVIFAYCVRFFAIAAGTIDAAFGKVSPNLAPAARSLGQGRCGVLTGVYLPLIRSAVATAGLLIFVDSVKELPATLLLYSEQTLATKVYNRASAEDFSGAAPAALMIVSVSLIAVGVMATATRDR
ncbi:MAG: iron ABC transporter permease [Rhodobacteraceae bacterium]|nr:iron ABC transporter permease [Paracoccaceae bacterium]